ncbi:MAG: extracellular solute-binding protein [Anaerolineae bacterium]|nr:extracellular solute-binding protein [Anaerolineae bacterium]
MDLARERVTRRVLLRTLVCTAAGASLGACGPKTTPQVVKETQVVRETIEVVKEVTAAPAPEVKLTLWHHWGGTREPLMKKALDDFAARNQGLTVEPTLIPWDRKEEAVLTAVAAGQAPDVLMLNAAEMPPYALNKALNPIDDMVAQVGIQAEEVYESDWKASSYAGKQWGLPQTVGGAAFLLFFNTASFVGAGLDPTKPPATWGETLEAATTLLKKEGDEIKQLGLLTGVTSWSWLNFLAENDAAWLSPDGREVQMDNQGAVEALEWIVHVTDAQGGAERVAAFTSAGGDADPFMSGRAAMTYQGVWQYYIIKTNAPELEYSSALAPLNRGKWHEANYGPHLYTLPAGTKHTAEAWKLLLWLTREAGGCDFLTAQLRPSPWKACNENSPVSKVADYWPVVLSALDATRAEPLTPLFNRFASIWDEMLEKAMHHQSTAAEAIKWAAAEMSRANEEFWAKQ